jgi:putative transposase
MSEAVTANLIAEALGQTKQNINQRADRECWPHEWQRGKGGRQKAYRVLPLPAEVRTPVLALLARQEAVTAAAQRAGQVTGEKLKAKAAIGEKAAEAARQFGLAKFATLPEKSKRGADARAAILGSFDQYAKCSGYRRRRAELEFCDGYNDGSIDIGDWIRAEVPTCCPNSLANWRKKISQEGLVGLAGKHGQHRKGQGIIDTTPELRDFILGMISKFPHCEPSLIMTGITGRFDAYQHPHYRTLQRWIAKWKEDNAELLMKLQNPDGWRNHFMAAFGFADQSIVALNQRWETDSTATDIMLFDPERNIKTRHNIVGVIDVYSRRLKLYVSRSSSATAVASLLRATMLDWGVPKVLGTDNGSDFVSHYIKRVVSGLEIEQDIAPPFTPDHKPFIERAFHTFSHSLLELLPGFVGHNVTERKAIESRRSFAERLMKKGQGDAPIELHMTPEQLQAFCDNWVENFYHQKGHSGLKGETPFQRAAGWQEPVRRIVDPRALDVLLAPAPGSGSGGGKGEYTVGKKGVRYQNSFYADPDGVIFTMVKKQVLVLLDESDIGRIFIFKVSTGEFLCVAECPELTGRFNRQEIAAAGKVLQNRNNKEGKARMTGAAHRANVFDVAAETLHQRAIDTGKMVMFPAPSVEHTTEALRAAGVAAEHAEDPLARVHEGTAPSEPARVINLRPVRDAAQTEADDKDRRFARWKAIGKAVANGEPVEPSDLRWHANYSRDPECRARLKSERMVNEGRVAG